MIGAGLAVLLLTVGVAGALAVDSDSSNPTLYNDDNYSEGFNAFQPHDCWRAFDMSYYGGYVWEAFVKGTGNAGDEMAVYVAQNDPSKAPTSKPTHYRVIEPETWEDSWGGDHRKPNLVRFVTFKDKLFLYVAKTYDYDTGSILRQKQISPIEAEYVDGTEWNPPSTIVCSNRPGAKTTSPRVIRGLVVKVINDTLNIFLQYGGTRDLYRITSTDAVHFSAPQKVYTFTGADSLLNGDVIARGSDKAPLFVFLTKDDADGGDDATGIIKLWTFDPKATTNAVSYVATLPGHDPSPGHYRDATLLAGDVAGCTPYGTNNLQIWGIGWGSDDVYHMQFVFNSDGKSGSFYPAGIVAEGSASSHVDEDWRGYLTACMAPQQTSDGSLQQYARVWWWGSTDIANAHGRSLKYGMDLLKRTGSNTIDTGKDSDGNDVDYSPAWILEGVIYGLPPYYPNGTPVGKMASSYNINFALSSSQTATNFVTGEKTLSISYGGQGFFGTPSTSAGLSYTNAVQQTSQATTTTTIKTLLSWSPDSMGAGTAIDVGAQAFGIFFVPKITNDQYELTAPDGKDLEVALYYTYISSGSDLIDEVFDKTATPEKPNPNMDPVAQAYWHGVAPYPNSMTYWDPGWTSSATPPDGTAIYGEIGYETNDYTILDKVWFKKAIGSAAKTYTLTQTQTDLASQTSTNSVDVYAGAFGFKGEWKGSLTVGSSSSTTFGQELGVTYGLPGWDGDAENDYLIDMSLDMYLLKAKTDKAFWVPDGAEGQHPWCLTWHVRHWESFGVTEEHLKEGPSSTALLTNTRTEIGDSVAVPAGIRTALVAKLKAARAAADRGDAKTVRNLLNAVCNQIEAQSGKAIPTLTAERLLDLLHAIDVDALVAGR